MRRINIVTNKRVTLSRIPIKTAQTEHDTIFQLYEGTKGGYYMDMDEYSGRVQPVEADNIEDAVEKFLEVIDRVNEMYIG